MSNHSLSTHILDTANGGAAVGVKIQLHRQEEGKWSLIGEGVTGEDGRCSFDGRSFVSGQIFTAGTYKYVFFTGDYFKKRNNNYIFPVAEVIFECNADEKYHIPLLISPFSYTTYRGK